MACVDCNDSSPISLTGSFFPGSPCMDNPDCSGSPISSACVYYNGPNLSCSGILTLDSVETALMKIDEQICAIVGDYTTYNMHCLPTWFGETIDTQEKFVDAISDYVCTLNDAVETFIGTTYPAAQTAITDRIADLEVPGITCSSASVINSDTLQQVLTKYCTKFGEIDDDLDISGVDWNECFTVVSPPTTLEGGFQLHSDQICLLYDMIADGDALPTFNNYTNCLGGTSSDSTVTTIGLIITKLCAAPVFDNDDLSSTCITIPGDSTDLTTLVQNMLDAIDASSQNLITFDATDFDIVATDPMDPCAGLTVSLATPATQDRFVAVSASDASPGVLFTKLSAPGSTVDITNVSDTTVGIALSAGDRGDITVSGTGGSTWTIDSDAVTFAKMQNISTQKVLGRNTASSGDVEELSIGANMTMSGGVLNTLGRTLIGITKFTTSGTWTKPTGCTAVVVHLVAGGAGGAGGDSDAGESVVGAGGGAGAYSVNYITSGLGSTEAITVGAGGAGGIVGTAYEGLGGGSSSFGAHIVVDGADGASGTQSSGSSAIPAVAIGTPGGAIPTVSATTVVAGSGAKGENGLLLTGATPYTMSIGLGASSIFGGGGSFGLNTATYGAGGGGAGATNGGSANGTAGGSGTVIIYEYS